MREFPFVFDDYYSCEISAAWNAIRARVVELAIQEPICRQLLQSFSDFDLPLNHPTGWTLKPRLVSNLEEMARDQGRSVQDLARQFFLELGAAFAQTMNDLDSSLDLTAPAL
jgi:hypothetical protein